VHRVAAGRVAAGRGERASNSSSVTLDLPDLPAPARRGAARALVGAIVGAALSSVLALGCARTPTLPGADLLLVTVDTLRADAVGFGGGATGDTPGLDALASESLVFPRARTPIPITSPALASLLTGRWPRNHGLLDNAFDLGRGPTLVEALADAGYGCAAFLPSFLADKPGLHPGFDLYSHPTLGQPPRRAQELVGEALAWIEATEAAGDDPWFLWLHALEPHAPYAGPAEEEQFCLAAAGLAGASVPPSLRLPRPSGAAPLDDVQRTLLAALYRAEVRGTDRALAPLWEKVQARRSGGRALLTVFTADHGELLGTRHDYVGHTAWLYEEMLRVPLLLHRSDGFGRGVRSELDASLHDVAGTVAAALEVDFAPTDQALDLFASFAERPRRLLVAETFAPEGEFDQQAVFFDGRKLHRAVFGPDGAPSAARPDYPRLYDLSVGGEYGPTAEGLDLAPGQPQDVERLDRLFAAWSFGQSAPAEWTRPAVGGELQRALEALGYSQGAGAGGQ
jgi:arylsulfatase A-like enzyme